MDVSASSSVAASPAAERPAGASPARQNLQIALLKKALEGQKEQAAALMRETEGKGQILDIRA